MIAELLSPEFLKKYDGIRPRNAGRLFDVIYLRTYSRWLEMAGRRERWNETVARVVRYSMSLYTGPAKFEELRAEAEALYDAIFHLEMLPAGRTLWVGGTNAAMKYAECQFNCSSLVLNDIKKFSEMFHLLLCGAGVGFRIKKKDVAELPKLHTGVKLILEEYKPLPRAMREENTSFYEKPGGVMNIVVGDSKEGWVKSLLCYLYFLSTHTKPQAISINFNSVRPKGERIKTFGGRAAGPGGLAEMFEQVHKVIEECEGVIGTVDALDICCIIALNVVVGGTRRSSLIALGDPDDEEFINAKHGLWTDPEMRKKHWRVMANNSVVYDEGEKPTREALLKQFDRILHNGEPGFFNLGAAKKRRPNCETTNPCGEVLLADRGVCNLSTVILSSFVDSEGFFDFPALYKTVRLATRVGLRQTNVNLSMPEWDYVQKRDRLTGVSMTGIMDALDAAGIDKEHSEMLFSNIRAEAHEEAMKYSHEMRVPAPLLVTTLKPEGTGSQMPTVSSGLHRSYAPYYIRRIRVSNIDPVCQALRHKGVPNEPDRSKPDRIVFSFPMKSPAKIAANDEPALDQLDRYYNLQTNYVDHNCSCTLTFSEDEIDGLVDRILQRWDDTIGIALLPKHTTAYPQMPYEQITKEQYQEMMSIFPDLSDLADVINRFEVAETEDELEADPACAGGQCPIR